MTRYYGDPYKILGLTPDATEKEIRKAYRHLAMQYHPDRNPGDPEAEEKFKQVQWAYDTVTGTKKEASIPGKPDQYGGPFSVNEHPFFGFFWAMRKSHYSKKNGF